MSAAFTANPAIQAYVRVLKAVLRRQGDYCSFATRLPMPGLTGDLPFLPYSRSDVFFPIRQFELFLGIA